MATKKCTPAEWEIMQVLWESGTCCVRDVLDHLSQQGIKKAYTTIQTTMNTLVKKNFLSVKKIGLVNYYTPNVDRRDMIRNETRTLLSRVFNGSVPALASFLFASEDLSLDEIKKIKKTIEQKENELRGEE